MRPPKRGSLDGRAAARRSVRRGQTLERGQVVKFKRGKALTLVEKMGDRVTLEADNSIKINGS